MFTNDEIHALMITESGTFQEGHHTEVYVGKDGAPQVRVSHVYKRLAASVPKRNISCLGYRTEPYRGRTVGGVI